MPINPLPPLLPHFCLNQMHSLKLACHPLYFGSTTVEAIVNNYRVQEIMQGFKLKESKVMSEILSIDHLDGENQHSSEAKANSSICFSYHQKTKKHEITAQLRFGWILFCSRIFVGPWNVGGIEPPDNLDMEVWLETENHSVDIYVLGFQEIVPLNAANVLGPTNRKIFMKWNSLIGPTLNKRIPIRPVQEDKIGEPLKIYPLKEHICAQGEHGRDFQCIISRQMVGMFVTVWVRSDHYQQIRHLSVSSVGCGILGCLGNKGSISIRFCLHETSFCFVCSHLAAGEKEVDRRQRNTNAIDILSRTSFPAGSLHSLPLKILDHDRVVWLGDLNYRINMPDSATQSLIKRREWDTLLKKDQLKMELMEGHVFEGWHEGVIQFPPTYKYLPISEGYIGCDQPCKSKTRRTPPWCDRKILFGKGMKQIQYSRGESRLSDHRPVRAMFTVDV